MFVAVYVCVASVVGGRELVEAAMKRSTVALLATLVSLCAGQVTDPVTSDVNINCGACKVRAESCD